MFEKSPTMWQDAVYHRPIRLLRRYCNASLRLTDVLIRTDATNTAAGAAAVTRGCIRSRTKKQWGLGLDGRKVTIWAGTGLHAFEPQM